MTTMRDSALFLPDSGSLRPLLFRLARRASADFLILGLSFPPLCHEALSLSAGLPYAVIDILGVKATKAYEVQPCRVTISISPKANKF